jgi:putative PEP-CTERM system histidine kinase
MAVAPLWFSGAAFVAAAAALGLAWLLLARNRSSSFHGSLAAMLGATAFMHLANGLGLIDGAHALFWRRGAMVAELLQPAALLYTGLAFMRPTEGVENLRARWRARVVFLLGVVLAIPAWSDQVFQRTMFDDGFSWIAMGSFGQVLYVFIVIAMALGLAQLELVLRTSREPVRHQLKFILIGLGALAGYQIYQASQLLLLPVWRTDHVLVGSLATAISLGLMAYGLGRSHLREVVGKAYVSQQAFYGSVTFIVIGLYLLAVGIIGGWIRHTDQPLSVGLSTAVVFGATVGLVVILFSKTARGWLRRFIARHFYRSKFDYRAKWLEVTEAFQTTATAETILDRLLDILIQTFWAARISIWMFYEADRRFHQIRSVNPVNPGRDPQPLDLSHPVITQLLRRDEPVVLGETMTGEGLAGDLSVDPFLAATRAVLCFPIRSQNKLIAFVTLSKELLGVQYGTDDCDLLRVIAHHVGVLLSHARLAEERTAAAELDALHRFSAFCLHDLKNLAARLSLVIQNAEIHGQNPVFQESAMRTVAGTVQKMMALMTKLSLRPVLGETPESVDVNTLVAEIVSSLNGELRAAIKQVGESVPPVRVVRDQFHQVLLNLILNAQQAGGERGEIRISTEQENGSVVVTVADTGKGIGPADLRTLFQPFRTTKTDGLGIGLYECKRVIEAHGGTIRVESEVGRGTSVRIELPIEKGGSRLTFNG